MCPHGERRPCVRARWKNRPAAPPRPRNNSKDELVWRILSEGAPCARLTSSQYNLTSICLRSLVLLLVIQAISPAAQFLGEPPQHLLSVAPCLWNDVGLDVLDGAVHLGFHLTGGLLEGLRYSSFLSHTGR